MKLMVPLEKSVKARSSRCRVILCILFVILFVFVSFPIWLLPSENPSLSLLDSMTPVLFRPPTLSSSENEKDHELTVIAGYSRIERAGYPSLLSPMEMKVFYGRKPTLVREGKDEWFDYSNTPVDARRAHFHYLPAWISQGLHDAPPPVATVITTLYNCDEQVLETAKSILSQSLAQLEWIIVDDFTHLPASLHILRQLAALPDPRIRMLKNTDRAQRGLPGARNVAIAQARGKYILCVDGDDFIEPTYLEKAVWLLEGSPQAALANSWSVGFDGMEYHWRVGFERGNALLQENFLTASTVMRREVLNSVGSFDASLVGGKEDWELWLRMADAGYWGLTIPEVLFWYRRRPWKPAEPTAEPEAFRWPSIENEKASRSFAEMLRKKYANLYAQGVPPPLPTPTEMMRLSSDAQEVSMTEMMRRERALRGAEPMPFANLLDKANQRILVMMDAFQPTYHLGVFYLVDRLVKMGWEVTLVSLLAPSESSQSWETDMKVLTPDVFILPRFLPGYDYGRFVAYLIRSRRLHTVLLYNSQLAYHLVPLLRVLTPATTFVDIISGASRIPAFPQGTPSLPGMGTLPTSLLRLSAARRTFLHRTVVWSALMRKKLAFWQAASVIQDEELEDGLERARSEALYRIGVVHPCLSTDAFARDEEARKRVRNNLGLKKNQLAIAVLGGARSSARPLLALQIVAALQKRWLNWQRHPSENFMEETTKKSALKKRDASTPPATVQKLARVAVVAAQEVAASVTVDRDQVVLASHDAANGVGPALVRNPSISSSGVPHALFFEGGEQMMELEKKMQEFVWLNGTVKVLGDLTFEHLIHALSACDVALILNEDEHQGVPYLLQAMGSGLYVVAASAASREVFFPPESEYGEVLHSEKGESEEVEMFVKSLWGRVMHPRDTRRRGKKGRAAMVRRWSVDTYVENMLLEIELAKQQHDFDEPLTFREQQSARETSAHAVQEFFSHVSE